MVAVSATPGKTKHLQTHHITPQLRLCDCPGLVFPAVGPRELQPLIGTYPIDHLREPFTCVSWLAARIDIIAHYKLQFEDDVDSDRVSTWIICETLALKRGWLLKGGRADVYRAAKSMLKDALNGKLRTFFSTPPAL